jgi:pimeloyl-ACP methyl ester carboxylesterase
MRRSIFVLLLVAAAIVLVPWRRLVWLGLPKPTMGMFPNGMAYARLGSGARTLLLMPGGPGNAPPEGISVWMMVRAFRPFVERGYSVWGVVRKQGLPEGHSIADMADDYAELIKAEFDGRVDVALGVSYGGLVGLHLAARHPQRFGHIALGMAGYEVSERGKRIDYGFAEKLSQGKTVEAAEGMFEELYPDWHVPGVARLFGEVMGRFGFGGSHPSFASDVMVEAEAEVAFDGRAILPEISVPLLLIGGSEDIMFEKATVEETARLIPDCTLRMYEGKGHGDAMFDPRFCADILDFIEKDQDAKATSR